MTHAELQAENTELKAQVVSLQRQLDWLKNQLFGQKSEKRSADIPDQQLSLLPNINVQTPDPAEEEAEKITYTRRKAKRSKDWVNDSGLRFDDTVPVKTIEMVPDELKGEKADDYEVIGFKETFRLAQRPSSYEILCYRRPIIKLKEKQTLITPAAPFNVIDRSVADVSFMVGMIVDKFVYHLPLYRQHQRLKQAGIELSRMTLTNLIRRVSALLAPIVDAQLANVLRSKVLAMDETYIKAGHSQGKMKQGYYWPIYGDQDEVVFTFADTRGRSQIEKLLKNRFQGVLLTDGYGAYQSYVAKTEDVIHAQCWVHTRRKFVESEDLAPEAAQTVLDWIGELYQHEKHALNFKPEKKLVYRGEQSKPIVDTIFEWAKDQLQRPERLPSCAFTKALKYLVSREAELKVFLTDPSVAMDTNHLERTLRSIPMGRKNWLFCWTEMGAEEVGNLQSLLSTCKLHGIDPYVYLTDVLLRLHQHPNKQLEQLTPRLWKEHFAHQPLKSDLSNES